MHGPGDRSPGVIRKGKEVGGALTVAAPESRHRAAGEEPGQAAFQPLRGDHAHGGVEPEGGRPQEIVDMPAKPGPGLSPGKPGVAGYPGEPSRSQGRPDVHVVTCRKPGGPQGTDLYAGRPVFQEETVGAGGHEGSVGSRPEELHGSADMAVATLVHR